MEKVFFTVGDTVQVKQDLPNKQKMLVYSVDKTVLGEKPRLLGVTCIWYNTIGDLQKFRFSTKDLEHI